MVHFIDACRFGDERWHKLDSDFRSVEGKLWHSVFHPTALLYSTVFCHFILVPYLLFDFVCICVGTYLGCA